MGQEVILQAKLSTKTTSKPNELGIDSQLYFLAQVPVEVPWTSAVLIGVVTFLISRVLWDWLLTYLLKIRLTRILVFECAATVNKLGKTIDQINECNLNCDVGVPSFDDVCKLYSGFSVSPPLEDPRELIKYVKPRKASLIGFFFDRWARLHDLEIRYSAVHQRLIESIAQIEGNAESASWQKLAAREYFSQTSEELMSIRNCAIDLCHFSCRLFREVFSAAYLGRNFALIKDHSNGRWKSWKEFKSDEEKFQRLYSERLRKAQ